MAKCPVMMSDEDDRGAGALVRPRRLSPLKREFDPLRRLSSTSKSPGSCRGSGLRACHPHSG